jgi:hypothetical protein
LRDPNAVAWSEVAAASERAKNCDCSVDALGLSGRGTQPMLPFPGDQHAVEMAKIIARVGGRGRRFRSAVAAQLECLARIAACGDGMKTRCCCHKGANADRIGHNHRQKRPNK